MSGVAEMGDSHWVWDSEVEQQGQVRDPSPQGLGEESQLFPSLKFFQQQHFSSLCLTVDAPSCLYPMLQQGGWAQSAWCSLQLVQPLLPQGGLFSGHSILLLLPKGVWGCWRHQDT